MSSLLLFGAQLIDPVKQTITSGGLRIDNKVISEVGPHLATAQTDWEIRQIDCRGQYLAPGLIDTRARLGEPGREYRETLKNASLAAVAGGITTFVALPDTQPVIDDPTLLAAIARKGRQSRNAKVLCYAAATRGLLGTVMTEFGILKETGAIAITDAGRPIANSKLLELVLVYSRAHRLRFIQQPQDPDLSASGCVTAGAVAGQLGLAGIPAYAEGLMLARDLRVVAATGADYHASLLTTKESVELIRKAKQAGLAVTADTAPHYFCLNERELLGYRTNAKLWPPLKSESDRIAVRDALIDGTLDWVVTDHTPVDDEEKQTVFSEAAYGSIGFSTLLPMVLTLYHQELLTLPQALSLLTVKPAQLLEPSLEQSKPSRGLLQAGVPADLVLFDPQAPFCYDPSQGQARNSVFANKPAKGQVLMTIVDGRIVYENNPR